MKNNLIPLRVDEMHIDNITFVYAQYAGQNHVPVNPAAEIVACKGGPVDNPITSALVGALERLGLVARKSQPTEPTPAAAPAPVEPIAKKDASLEESVQDAMQDTARMNLYGVLYDMEYAIGQVINAPGFDDASRRAAVDAILDQYGLQIATLVAMIYAEKASAVDETATKAGKRHSAEDQKSIQTAHDAVGKIVDAAATAHAATSKLLEKPADDSAKSTVVDPPAAAPAVAPGVAPVTEPAPAAKSGVDELTAAFAALQQQITAALDPAALKSSIDAAVKSAVEPMQASVDAAVKTAGDAVARADAAEAEKSAAIARATTAEADALKASRERSAPGGHEDPKEAQQARVDAAKSAAEAAPVTKPTTLAQAVRLLHSVAPAA